METKILTKGWQYNSHSQYIIDDEVRIIAEVRGWGWIQKLDNPEAVQDSIGKLIAAAPDLLKALIIISEMGNTGEDARDMKKEAYEAIKKATE